MPNASSKYEIHFAAGEMHTCEGLGHTVPMVQADIVNSAIAEYFRKSQTET
jgi:pimeloyl-ACP methyl ester carboxylesterase